MLDINIVSLVDPKLILTNFRLFVVRKIICVGVELSLKLVETNIKNK